MKHKQGLRPREEAAELIECYIWGHRLAPHQKLPSERSMCEMWDLNRSTLRTAIRQLTEEGLIYSLQGSGTYVSPPKLERNLQDASSLTESVQRSGRVLSSVVLNASVMPCPDHVAHRLKTAPEHKIFYLRRVRSLDGVPFTIESAYLNYDHCQDIGSHDFEKESLYQALEDHGILLTHGSESIGITYATNEESRLLGIRENSPLYYLSGISDLENGSPNEYFKAVVRTDIVRFSCVLHSPGYRQEGSERL